MSRKQFSLARNYKRLEEAIEAVLQDSGDDAEYDLAIIPPDPSVVTDEDEGMVKYFGLHPAKQFIRGKPVRFG